MKNKVIPDLYLEQALVNELPADKRNILDNEGVPEKLDALRRSNQEILEKYDPGDVVGEIERRLGRFPTKV